ncbi:MAG: hypothetical protein K6C69_03505 [Lachnospiraceae bacterium]|nr:hypothetical protein [Lachnospiraceae bacterium]
MMELMQLAWNEYTKFIGSGLYMYLAYASMLYIICKDKKKRMVLGVIPALLLVLFFNPLFIKPLYYKFFFGTYWRLLWLIPSTLINAYTATQLITSSKHPLGQVGMAILVGIVIILSGTRIYSWMNYSHRTNWYKIPNVVLEVGYNMENYADSWYPTVIVPNELYCSMRQYTSGIRLLYGRDAEGYMSGLEDEDIKAVYEEMCKEDPDIEIISRVAHEQEVQCIVFNMDYHQVEEDLLEYGLVYTGDTDNYRYYTVWYGDY